MVEQVEGSFITIYSEDKNVCIGVDTGKGESFKWTFNFTFASVATIMAIYLNKRMDNILKNIREKAYEDGYKAGKHHQRKFKWFTDRFSDFIITGF